MAFYNLNPRFFYKSSVEPLANFYQFNIIGRVINGVGGPLIEDAVAAPPVADYCCFDSDNQTSTLLVTGNALTSEAYFGNDWVYDGDTGAALNLGIDVAKLNATNVNQPVVANFLQANLSTYDGIKIAVTYQPDAGFPNAPNSIIFNLAINTAEICNNKYFQSHDYLINAGDRVIVTLDFADCEEADPTGVCSQMCGTPTGSVAATNLDSVGNIGIRIKQNPLQPYLYEGFGSFGINLGAPISATPLGSATDAGVTTVTIPNVTLDQDETVIIGGFVIADTITSVTWNTISTTPDTSVSFNSAADNAALFSYRNIGPQATGDIVITTPGSVSNLILLTATKVVGLTGNQSYTRGLQPTVVENDYDSSATDESWSITMNEPDSGFSRPTMVTSLFAAGLVITNYFNGSSQPLVSFGSWANGFTLDQQTFINDSPTNAYGLSQAHYITENLGKFKAAKTGNFTIDSDYWGALIYLYA